MSAVSLQHNRLCGRGRYASGVVSPAGGLRTQFVRLVRFLVVVAIGASPLSGQEFVPDDQIRQDARRILSDAEFRYFDHLDEEATQRPSRFGPRTFGFSSEGTGSTGGSSGDGDGRSARTRPESTPRTERRNRSDSSAESNQDPGSVTIPMGGVGAIGNVVGAIFHGLAYLVLAAVCLLIVYLVIAAIMSRQRDSESSAAPQLDLALSAEDDHSPGELPADVYLSRARELAEQRKYREAIAYLLLGGMSAIERANLIRHRRGLTLRDYLRALRGRDPHFDGFKTMIRLYEPVGFGRRIASHQTFQEALAGYERAVTAL